ncbi:MAG: protein jag [Oscillospiraceae bacterium]|nr:protein jag [Oscillospiraceae bacterium]
MERNEIFTAKTFEEAKKLAAEAFGVNEQDINFEVIEQPKKGLFGSKGDFRVRAICQSNVDNESTEHSTVVETADVGKFKSVIDYLEKIFSELGVSGYSVNVKKVGDNNVIDITGDNLGIIIGRRGETLDALQYLAILAGNKGSDENRRSRLIIDCNGYREKRTDTLESLAIRTSNKVIKQGRRITLEPMNPYERRIIHSKVASIDGVYSNSIGDEPYRKVVISAEVFKKRGVGSPERSERGNRGERNDRDRGGSRSSGKREDGVQGSSVVLTHTPGEVSSSVQSRSYKKSAGFSTSFERDYKRTAAPDISKETTDVEKNTTLYGKIEL